jgi:NADH-quinone oxidoreductase subunit N
VLLAGMALLLIGLGFKVAAVPFQWWTPDVYQGAPSPATGFMAAAAKTAGFAALLRIFLSAFPTQAENWRPLVWVLAALTMVVGAVLAVVQTDVKRMLAYSSVSLAGSLYYLLAYTFMVTGSFAIVTAVGGRGDSHHGLDAYRGLSAQQPVLALAFTILLLSQAGIPFTTGFIAKFNVISAVVSHGHAPDYILGVIAMLAATIATYFYLRIILAMFSAPRATPEGGEPAGGGVGTLVATRPKVVITTTVGIAIAICVVFTLAFGIYPSPIIHLAEKATLLF